MKKFITTYITLIVLDFIGFVSVYFFIATHGVLFLVAGTDLYKLLINKIEKNGSVVSELSRALIAFFLITLSSVLYGYTYYFLASLYKS